MVQCLSYMCPVTSMADSATSLETGRLCARGLRCAGCVRSIRASDTTARARRAPFSRGLHAPSWYPPGALPLRQGAAGDCARGQTVWRRVALRRRGSGALALVARVRQRRCVLDGTCVRASHHTPNWRSMWDASSRPRSRHRKSCSGACPTCPVHSPSLEGAQFPCHLRS